MLTVWEEKQVTDGSQVLSYPEGADSLGGNAGLVLPVVANRKPAPAPPDPVRMLP